MKDEDEIMCFIDSRKYFILFLIYILQLVLNVSFLSFMACYHLPDRQQNN